MSGTAAWWTDPHFELLAETGQREVLRAWSEATADCAIVTGDISHGSSTLEWLRRLARAFERPIYFVLGNHDFYGTSIAAQREAARKLCDEVDNLFYLSSSGSFSLSATTALVGHDGWGDMREGEWQSAGVRPPDFDHIDDLKSVAANRSALRERLGQLGDEAAGHLARVLPEAMAHHEHVWVATHVPPFPEASWYEGRNSTAPWLPFFCCRAVGDALLAAAEQYPSRRLLVLCGHCHGSGDVQVRENLRILTGGAEPCSPQLQQLLEFA
ncbi:MAG: metallophosphoesterase family protein [Thermoguttaceae bacterium]